MDTLTLAALIETIEAAIDGWDGADWTHERIVDGAIVTDDEGTPEYCEGGHPGTCERCREAREAAATAGGLGREAIRALRTDDDHTPDLLAALECVSQSVSIEQQYGDSPMWRPVERLIESMIANNMHEIVDFGAPVGAEYDGE